MAGNVYSMKGNSCNDHTMMSHAVSGCCGSEMWLRTVLLEEQMEAGRGGGGAA